MMFAPLDRQRLADVAEGLRQELLGRGFVFDVELFVGNYADIHVLLRGHRFVWIEVGDRALAVLRYMESEWRPAGVPARYHFLAIDAFLRRS